MAAGRLSEVYIDMQSFRRHGANVDVWFKTTNPGIPWFGEYLLSNVTYYCESREGVQNALYSVFRDGKQRVVTETKMPIRDMPPGSIQEAKYEAACNMK